MKAGLERIRLGLAPLAAPWWALPPQWAAWLVGLLLLLLVGWSAPAAVTRLDLLVCDLLMPRRPAAADPAVVIAIDDESLASLGRWPWPRSVHATLVERLRVAGVSVIGLPLMFAEPDSANPENDQLLAHAIARHGRVVLPIAPLQQPDGSMGEGKPSVELLASEARLGHVDVEIDPDGQARRVYLQAGAGQPNHAAFGLAVRDLLAPASERGALPGLRPSQRELSTPVRSSWVRDYEVLLPRSAAQPRIPYVRAMHSPEILVQLKGRVVFVGITAAGLGGELVTPISGTQTSMPAVEFHANVFEALRSDSLVEPATPLLQLGFGLLLVSALLLWPWRGRHPLALAAAVTVSPLLFSAVALYAGAVWLAPVGPMLALLAGCGVWLGRHVRSSRRQIERMRQHSLATLQAIGDGVLTLDLQRVIRYANAQAQAQFDGSALIGTPLASALPLASDSLALLRAAVDESLRSAIEVRLTSNLSLTGRTGPARILRASVNPLRGPDGAVDGAVLVLADVTEAVASESRLAHAASHDRLTNLPNRLLLHERLGLALGRVQRLGSQAAVLFLDLDRFKRINDSLGHRQGDEVLKVTAERLRTMCRSTDFVARWGGDEFVVLMEDVSGPDAVAVAAAKLVAVLGDDIEADGVRLASSCSVGIALAPQDGNEIDLLLAKADTAMHRAKSNPGSGFHFYSAELKLWTREYLAIEVDLRRGLRDEQFELHYQPQYELRSGALVGFEALLRWRRTPEALVQPDQFIGVAEETGLIVEIGAWVVMRVARDLAAALAAGRVAMPVAVNVSARQCANRNIVEVVRSALQQTSIPAALLKLEITETTAMSDAAQVAALLEEISALGVRIAVDDFGTGYSSLAYLKRFPIDELKIDRSFVQDVATNADDAAIVRATIALAHELGILVVAEGVETEQQSQYLIAQHCDIGQGFLYGRPLPLSRTEPAL